MAAHHFDIFIRHADREKLPPGADLPRKKKWAVA